MQDLVLTGRTCGAEDGAAAGFSQYVVDPGQALAKAVELAERAAQTAPLTTFAVLHALPRVAEAGLRAFLEGRAAKVTHG